MRAHTRILIAVLLSAPLAACGTAAQNSDIGMVHTGFEGKTVVPDEPAIQVVESGSAATDDRQNVTGYSCKNKIWEPAPSRENAINMMKSQAAERGFNAVHSVNAFDDPFSVAKNCWSGIEANGVAFTMVPAKPAR